MYEDELDDFWTFRGFLLTLSKDFWNYVYVCYGGNLCFIMQFQTEEIQGVGRGRKGKR